MANDRGLGVPDANGKFCIGEKGIFEAKLYSSGASHMDIHPKGFGHKNGARTPVLVYEV